MWVKAAPGLQVPRENKPRDPIGDADVIEVPETAYYLRRLFDGDLVAADPVPDAAKASARKRKE